MVWLKILPDLGQSGQLVSNYGQLDILYTHCTVGKIPTLVKFIVTAIWVMHLWKLDNSHKTWVLYICMSMVSYKSEFHINVKPLFFYFWQKYIWTVLQIIKKQEFLFFSRKLIFLCYIGKWCKSARADVSELLSQLTSLL